MTLHFAYGSNMSADSMRRRCPAARALGPAQLDGWRLMIMRDGYATVARAPGASVHGVLWRLTPRDLAALNIFESLDSGLYVRRILPVRQGARVAPALVFVARERRPGRARPGYQDAVVASAREWGLPAHYLDALSRFIPSRLPGTRPAETGEIG